MSGGKGWANPAPAGLVALAMACFIYFASLTGRVDATATILMGCWLLGGFVVQLIVAVIEILEGNTTGGNVFTYFCAFFMLTGAVEMFVKFWAMQKGIALDARIDGYAWMALSGSLILWSPAYLKESNGVMGVCVIVMCFATAFITLIDLGVLGAAFKPIPGYLLLISGIMALYIGASVILNTAFQKVVLPLPGPILK